MTQICFVGSIAAEIGAIAVIVLGSEGGVGGRCATASVDMVEGIIDLSLVMVWFRVLSLVQEMIVTGHTT